MISTHSFQHEAMKTTFALRIDCEDSIQAKKVAHACIERLDQIENILSRYVEGSDVWQINHMQADQTLFVSQDCYDCIRMALDAYQQTEGLFDITLGRQIEHQKNELEGDSPTPLGQIMVDPDRPAIHCLEPGREIDLGGIGKGFALDRMKELMIEWGIENALLSAGGSTQLAVGPKAWKVQLTGDHNVQNIDLKNSALSASGVGIQGSHIVSPRTSSHNYAHQRIWILESTAALADARSTAAMLMNSKELAQLSSIDCHVYAENEKGIHIL